MIFFPTQSCTLDQTNGDRGKVGHEISWESQVFSSVGEKNLGTPRVENDVLLLFKEGEVITRNFRHSTRLASPSLTAADTPSKFSFRLSERVNPHTTTTCCASTFPPLRT